MTRQPKRTDSRRSARSRPDYQKCLPLLREAREKAGISQAELGRRLGKPQSWVEKCEAGDRRVDFVELILIAEALDLSPVSIVQESRRRMKP